jgi:hypothetical protein
MEGGVEPLGAAALLDPIARAGEEPEPNPTDPMMVFAATAPWSTVFMAALSTTAFAIVTPLVLL